MVAGTTPTTFKLDPKWWQLSEQPVVSAVTVATWVSSIYPNEAITPPQLTVYEQADITLTTIAPLEMVHHILMIPLLHPVAANKFLSYRMYAWHRDTLLEPLMQWM